MSSSSAAIRVGVWSRTGEFLGVAEIPGGHGGEGEGKYISASRGADGEGMTLTAYRFPGGYRVRIEEWWKGGEETLWLAPVEEGEEGYMGLFSEVDLRAAFPHLAAEHSGSEGTALSVRRTGKG